jgi:hypothetical protein
MVSLLSLFFAFCILPVSVPGLLPLLLTVFLAFCLHPGSVLGFLLLLPNLFLALPFLRSRFLPLCLCCSLYSWLSAFAPEPVPNFLPFLLSLFWDSVFILCFLTSPLTLFLAFHQSSCLFLAFCLRYSLCSWLFAFASDFVPGCLFWSCLSSWLSALTLCLAFCLSSCLCSWLSAFPPVSVPAWLSAFGTQSVPGFLPFLLTLSLAFCLRYSLSSWLSTFCSCVFSWLSVSVMAFFLHFCLCSCLPA